MDGWMYFIDSKLGKPRNISSNRETTVANHKAGKIYIVKIKPMANRSRSDSKLELLLTVTQEYKINKKSPKCAVRVVSVKARQHTWR